MSKQILNESWAKLEEIFNSLNDENVSQALKQYKVSHICVDGITSTIRGTKKVDDRCFLGLLKELGFEQKEALKGRMCVVGDCKWITDLYGLLNHLIGYHQIPAKNVGKLIPYIKNDSRKRPSKTEIIKYNLTHPQMSTD